MEDIRFYRDEQLPFELKMCNTINELSYKKHAHEEYSLGIVQNGNSVFWCEGQETLLYKHTLVCIPDQVIHACNPLTDEPWQYTMLYVQPAWMQEFLACHHLPQPERPFIRPLSCQQEIISMNQLLTQLANAEHALAKEAAFLALVECMLREPKQLIAWREPNNEAKVASIKEYLQQHFAEPVSLQRLEEVSGLNKFSIIRAFKKEYSITPHLYQTLLRINYAQQELKKRRAIADIACDSGFYDQSHFHKVFKEYAGLTPEQYQQ